MHFRRKETHSNNPIPDYAINFLLIRGNPGFKSRKERFIKTIMQITEERLTRDLQHDASKSGQT